MRVRSSDQAAMLRLEGTASYVYLLPLMDGSAFKVGMTKQPLQRFYSFHRRYFERFDLHEAQLLSLGKNSRARSIESSLKTACAAQRADAPSWVNDTAGGYTEWFCASEYWLTVERLGALAAAAETRIHVGFDFLKTRLVESRAAFELWAVHEAERLCEDAYAVSLGHDPRMRIDTLRDWLDAYRHFAIELFEGDAALLSQIRERAITNRIVAER